LIDPNTPSLQKGTAVTSLSRRRLLQYSAAAGTLALPHAQSFAQGKFDTLRIIVGFPPGGTTDGFARRIGEKLRGLYANNVIIDNKPGAGGQLGVINLKTAATDGSAMLYTPASMLTIYPHSYSRLQYSQADVSPITIGHASDHAFVVGSAVPAAVTTLVQYLDWAKANPGKATIGNPGAGSMPHLLAGMLAKTNGAPTTNVPFAGSGPGVPQVLGGQISAMCSPLGDWVQHAATGRVRILATSGPSRSPFVPNVPTFKEQGFADLVVREWFGFFMPAAASQAAKDRASTVLRAALIQPDLVESMKPLAVHVSPTTQEEHAARMKQDTVFAGKLVSALGFKADS
jgi:tripartite-type tricarboxylate transporter receptor subunit TctC